MSNKCQKKKIEKFCVINEKTEVEQKVLEKTQKKSINQEKEDKSNEIQIKSGKNIHTFKKTFTFKNKTI